MVAPARPCSVWFPSPSLLAGAGLRLAVASVAAALMIHAGPVEARIDPAADAAAATTSTSETAAPSPPRARMNQRVFDQVWGEVRRDYYDPRLHGVDWRAARAAWRPKALAARDDRELYIAVDGLLDLLDDDHAGAVGPAAARRQDNLRKRRAIVGLTLYPEADGVYRIERIRDGSPAAEASIGLGWRLQTAAGGGWNPDQDVVGGQPVALRFIDEEGQPREVTLTPREMEPLPAFVADRSRPGLLILRIDGFEQGLGRWMGDQLAETPADTDVVIDLRGNPGGLLVEADAMLSCFLPRDEVWATQTARSGRSKALRINAGCGDLAAPVANALAVVVDRTSRSAAELTPAALQEASRAVVVGERTAGAVLISQESRLPDGGRLTLSRADFVTARGVRLEKHGVLPDVEAPSAPAAANPAANDDAPLDAAIAALRTEAPMRRAAAGA